MSPATTATGTAAASRQLGVPPSTLYGHVRRWHPPVGTGHRIALTGVDLMVCRALRHIGGHRGGNHHATARLQARAEAAIRARPARWLVLTENRATTVATVEAAANTVLDTGARWARVIHLDPQEDRP